MIDLGDLYAVPFYTYNDAGTLTDATTLTVTLTLPDGLTTAVLTVGSGLTHTGTGIYTPAYATAVVGRYAVRAVAAGAVVGAYANAFDVAPADPGFLFSLEDARAICRLPAGDTSGDALMRDYIAAVTGIVEFLCGPQILATHTYVADGGRHRIILPEIASSIVSVTEAGVALTTNDYTLDASAGVLTRGTYQEPVSAPPFFAFGLQNIVITYKVGGSIISPQVLVGARMVLRHFWQGTQQGNRPAFGSADSAVERTTTVLGYLIPNVALAFLKAAPPSAPGFA